MKKILGLDIGVSSIGWAIIEVNSDGAKSIVNLGSRIIPLSTDDKDEFSTGNAISKNQKRTLRRTQRKGYDRYQLRRTFLKEELSKLNMLPNETLIKLNPVEIYGLRDKAVKEKISLQELGRVLLHLNQKRGYKSSRKDENADKKETEYVATVKNRHQELKEVNHTIGQYFYYGLLNQKHYRVKEQIFPREAYQEEFDAIVKQQQIYHASVLTNEVCNKLRNEIIFFQRPLKSQKGLVSVCEFEGRWAEIKAEEKTKEIFIGPKVAPRSSPIFQVCKIWETINNIVLKNKKGEAYVLSDEQRSALFYHLDNNENLTFTELFKILDLKKEDGWYGNKQLLKGLQGNTTKAKIADCLNELQNKEEFLRFDLSLHQQTGEVLKNAVSSSFENEPLYRIWHIIYSLSEKRDVINALERKFQLPQNVAESLSKIDFTKTGFGNKSAKAIRKILPFLQKGFQYSDSCAAAGYNHSNSLTKEENEARVLLEKLSNLPKNSLRQPIVEKILNQVINLVNVIIKKYGRPTEIRIELARELKQSKEERNQTFRNISKRERENQIIAKRIETEYGLRSTKRNIDKWRLFEEMSGKCIYCNKGIELSDFLRGDQSDIEHIIPRSRLFDDSLQNKTIAHRKCNADKGNLTAYDFMQGKGKDAFEDYTETIEVLYKNGKISKSKRDKLLMAADKIPNDFIERQLRETQYISRKAKEILQQVCHHVHSTSGSVTDYLRHAWGWDEVLMNLQLDKYREVGLTEWRDIEYNGHVQKKEFIKGWTKRMDHRHHAIDAITIACTTQNIIQRLSNLNQIVEAKFDSTKRDELLAEESLKNYVLAQKPFSTNQLQLAADNILVSLKSGKKVATMGNRKIKQGDKKIVVQNDIVIPRGPLSEESVYGKIWVMNKKAPLKEAFENPQLIIKERIKKLIVARIEKFSGDKKKAFNSVRKDPIYLNEASKEILEYATVYKEEVVIKYKLDGGFNKASDIVDEGVKKIVLKRLNDNNNNPKEAFKDPLYLDEERTIEIKTVRCFTGLSAIEPIKVFDASNGLEYEKYVKPGNNHHIAIYLNENGEKVEHIVTFWHAVERKKYGVPVIITNPDETWIKIEGSQKQIPEPFLKNLPQYNWKYLVSLQQNEYFVLGMNDEEWKDALRKKDLPAISEKSYRVQSISSNDYWFFHHLETKVEKTAEAKSAKRHYRTKSIGAFYDLKPRKVHITLLGELGELKEEEKKKEEAKTS
jgi:CRISPR-associated endonuclease Csn1